MAGKDLIFTVLGIDRASDTFDRVGRSMDKMGNTALKSLGGVTAGAGVAAAAVAGSVAAIPLAFIGLAAIAVRENEQVRRSFRELGAEVKGGLAQDAAPMAAAFVSAAGQIRTAYNELRPQMAAAFAAAAPHVATLTSGVTEFAHGAMPGMVTAVSRADPVMQGFRGLLRDTGVGLGQFFDVVSVGAPQAGAGIEHFGTLVRGVLPETGHLLVNLTGLWAEHGDQVVTIVTQVIGVLADLSGSAMPGVSSSVGIALDVLSGVLAVIGPLSGALGPLIAGWIALAAAMRGLAVVRSVVDNVTSGINQFREASAKASGPTGAGQLKAVTTNLMGVMGGPWGVAVTAAITVLALFGQRSQQVASDQHSLTSALRSSGGAFDDNARRALVNSDTYKDIADSVEKAGISHGEYVDAIIQGGPALDAMRQKLGGIREANTELINTANGLAPKLNEQAQAAQELGNQSGVLRDVINGANEELAREKSALQGASGAMAQALPGTDALKDAVATLGDATATTADHADALNTAWQQLFGIQLSLEEATANWEEGLDNLRETFDAAKGGVDGWRGSLIQADGAINVTTESGRRLRDQLEEQGNQYRTLAMTAYDTALQQTGSQEMARNAAISASQARREQFISERTQMGMTADQARQLADRYLGLPDDILTLIRADSSNAQGIVDAYINRNNGRQIHIGIVTGLGVGKTIAATKADGGLVGYATGGHVRGFPSGGRVVGPGGPRSDSIPAWLSNGEYVINAASTKRFLPLLELINGDRGQVKHPTPTPGGRPAGDRPTVSVGTMIVSPHQTPTDVARELDWLARGRGGL